MAETVERTDLDRERVAAALENLDLDGEDLRGFWGDVEQPAAESEGDEGDEPEPSGPTAPDLGEYSLAAEGREEPEGEPFRPVTGGGQTYGMRFDPDDPFSPPEEPEERTEPEGPDFATMRTQWKVEAMRRLPFDEQRAQTLSNEVGPLRRAADAAQAALEARAAGLEEAGDAFEGDPQYRELFEQAAQAVAAVEPANAAATEAGRRAQFAEQTDEQLSEASRELMLRWEEAQDNLDRGVIPRISRNRREKAEAERDALVVERARVETELAERQRDRSEVEAWMTLSISESAEEVKQELREAVAKAARDLKAAQREGDPDRIEQAEKERNRAAYRVRKGPTEEEIWRPVRAKFSERVKSRGTRDPVRTSSMADFLPKGPVHH
jgi:hypothetical protein